MWRIVFNVIAFQAVWWACVLGAAEDRPEIGIAAAVVAAALHLLLVPAARRELLIIAAVVPLGYAADSALTACGVLGFSAAGESTLPIAPAWIAALWLAFATTLNTSLRLLQRWPIAAAILGFVGGPMAYGGALAFGVVLFPHGLLSGLALGATWAALLPLQMHIVRRIASNASTPADTELPPGLAPAEGRGRRLSGDVHAVD